MVYLSACLLLGSASAMALPQTVYKLSQADDSTPSVVVDTEATGTTTPTSTDTSIRYVPDTQTRFSCQAQNGQYTVMYQPESQPSQFSLGQLLQRWVVAGVKNGAVTKLPDAWKCIDQMVCWNLLQV